MSKTNFHHKPIFLTVLAHTGRPLGDSSSKCMTGGYRSIGFISAEEEMAGKGPDPLEDLREHGINCVPVYSVGDPEGTITGGRYGKGIGGFPMPLARRPVRITLRRLNSELAPYGIEVCVLDALRLTEGQVELHKFLIGEIGEQRLPGRNVINCRLEEQITVFRAADDVGSFVDVVKDDRYLSVRERLCAPADACVELVRIAQHLKEDLEAVIYGYLASLANLGAISLAFDEETGLAHRGGFAIDWFPRSKKTGRILNMGVPFDYPAPVGVALTPCAFHFFEDKGNWEVYRRLAETDVIIKRHLASHGIETVTNDVCRQIRDLRRICFHAGMAVDGAHFDLECFHWCFPNVEGNQFNLVPMSGNPSGALLRNARHVTTGQIVGTGRNDSARRMALSMAGQIA
ncbi:MAG: hypothetical protein EXS55_01895 [Candidatus Magasanikbacteria bacterium]|nr:hypothetical protein [Candidatus Magasanikbacteria bacterium]